MTTVAIQGERGSYSHEAALLALGPGIGIQSHARFAAVFAALAGGEVDLAVVPVENTIVGPIRGVVELTAASHFCADGEVLVRVNHCLVGRPGASLTETRRVASHPVALAQCGGFLRRYPAWSVTTVPDTAGGVRAMASGELDVDAVIASARAAERYDCPVLAEAVQDRADNFTRFVVLRRGQASTRRSRERASA